jgi:hypothetical protein
MNDKSETIEKITKETEIEIEIILIFKYWSIIKILLNEHHKIISNTTGKKLKNLENSGSNMKNRETSEEIIK